MGQLAIRIARAKPFSKGKQQFYIMSGEAVTLSAVQRGTLPCIGKAFSLAAAFDAFPQKAELSSVPCHNLNHRHGGIAHLCFCGGKEPEKRFQTFHPDRKFTRFRKPQERSRKNQQQGPRQLQQANHPLYKFPRFFQVPAPRPAARPFQKRRS